MLGGDYRDDRLENGLMKQNSNKIIRVHLCPAIRDMDNNWFNSNYRETVQKLYINSRNYFCYFQQQIRNLCFILIHYIGDVMYL